MVMEQYEKSGPAVERKVDATQDLDSRMRDLQATVSAQSLEIDQLKRDLRRLQMRMDQAARVVNRMNNNG
jgi:uncharacterized coiled-coil protein SlyX